MSDSAQLSRARVAWMRKDAAATLQWAQPLCGAADPRVRADALMLCADVLTRLGRRRDALGLLQSALQANPRLGEAWLARGRLLQEETELQAAEQAFLQAAQLLPRSPDPWIALAELQAAQGQPASHAQSLRRACERAPMRADLALQEIEALDRIQRGSAEVALTRALQRFPDNVDLLLRRARWLLQRTRRTEALVHLERAIAADPTHQPARFHRAQVFTQSRRYREAEADLEVILQQSPRAGSAWLQRARIRHAMGDSEGAATFLQRALEESRPLAPANRAQALLLRAKLHATHGELAAEWADLCAAQSVLAAPQLEQGEDGSTYLRLIARRTARLQPGRALHTAAASWPVDAPADLPLSGRPPVFVFGFPRSGTTLAERILGAHPALTATDELNLLGAVLESLRDELDDRPLDQLTPADLRHLRSTFVAKARRAGFEPSRTRLIDKNPLNFVFIDVVRRVFPDAPVLMLFRDPRDCVWSSFQQAFWPNAALVLTRDLPHTARLYADTMALWEVGRSLPGLRLTELHYEHLVRDLEAGARALVAATGEAWDPAVLDFQEAMGTAFVRTPSFAAVGRSVTRSRVGRWRRHADKLSELVELAPYVARWGVEAVAPDLLDAHPEPPSR